MSAVSAVSDDRLESAPGGLGFVQEFVNTRYLAPPRGVDPLGDETLAQAWLDAAWQRHGAAAVTTTGNQPPAIELAHRDLPGLRAARRALAGLISGDRDPADRGSADLVAAVTVRVGADGVATLEPRGGEGGRVLAILLAEVWCAQQAGTWKRLKICRNERCAIVFYDRSPAASAVWHSAKRCGNAPNLRASRARRRTDERQR